MLFNILADYCVGYFIFNLLNDESLKLSSLHNCRNPEISSQACRVSFPSNPIESRNYSVAPSRIFEIKKERTEELRALAGARRCHRESARRSPSDTEQGRTRPSCTRVSRDATCHRATVPSLVLVAFCSFFLPFLPSPLPRRDPSALRLRSCRRTPLLAIERLTARRRAFRSDTREPLSLSLSERNPGRVTTRAADHTTVAARFALGASTPPLDPGGARQVVSLDGRVRARVWSASGASPVSTCRKPSSSQLRSQQGEYACPVALCYDHGTGK